MPVYLTSKIELFGGIKLRQSFLSFMDTNTFFRATSRNLTGARKEYAC